MNQEKKDFAAWWIFIGVLFVFSIIIMTGLKFVGIGTATIVERKVFENSYQRSEALKSQIALYQAQAASLEGQLMDMNLDESLRHVIESQLTSIRIQLSAARGRE